MCHHSRWVQAESIHIPRASPQAAHVGPGSAVAWGGLLEAPKELWKDTTSPMALWLPAQRE